MSSNKLNLEEKKNINPEDYDLTDDDLEIVEAELKPVHPWDKLPGESMAWFRRFHVYLFMPPDVRSVRSAYREYCLKHTDKLPNYRPTTSWYSASRKFKWSDRAFAFDQFTFENIEIAQEEQQVLQMQRLKEDRELIARRCMESSVMLFRKAYKALQEIAHKDIALESIPALYKTAVILSDLGLTSKSETIGISEIVRNLGLEKQEGIKQKIDSMVRSKNQDIIEVKLEK